MWIAFAKLNSKDRSTKGRPRKYSDQPIVVCMANVYDNQISNLLNETKIYNPFLILADTAYDSVEWFEIASDLKFNNIKRII